MKEKWPWSCEKGRENQIENKGEGMHILENGKEQKQFSYDKQPTHFCREMCFLMAFWHFDENNDLESSKTLKWVLI